MAFQGLPGFESVIQSSTAGSGAPLFVCFLRIPVSLVASRKSRFVLQVVIYHMNHDPSPVCNCFHMSDPDLQINTNIYTWIGRE